MDRRFPPLLLVLPALAVGFSPTPSAFADDPPTERLNKRIDRVTLADGQGRPFALDSAAAKKATVVVFLSFDCPVASSYAAPLTELAKAYADRGVAVVGVVAGDEPPAQVRKLAADFRLGFPLVADPKRDAVAAFKAAVTPEAFVLDGNFVLRYRGRIDNAYSARLKRNAAVTSHDLKDALDAVLAGSPVKTPATVAIGCPVDGREQVAQPGAAARVNYHRDVEPILQANCVGCHRPGQVGPFALVTYKQAVNWADDIKSFTQTRKMPPWKPAGGPEYANCRRLSDADIRTLTTWVDAGCPQGDPKDAPPPVKFSDDWQLGTPDLVLSPAEDFHVGAAGADLFRCFVLPTGLTENKYIVGYEVKPGNPRVVHHTLNFWDTTGKARELAEKEKARAKPDAPDRGPGYSVGMGLGFVPLPDPKRTVPAIGGFGGWAPGQMAVKLPANGGFFLPKGADVVVQTHYHRTGKPEDDRIRIGLYFAKKPVEKAWQTVTIGGMSVTNIIPAGKADYRAKGSAWVTSDATVYSVMPHMHLIGRAVKVTMTPPGGGPVTLVDVPEWDYGWQETYWFKTPLKAKAGTRFDIEAMYDNSPANPNNPSHPPRTVFFGEQTTSEMLFGFIGVTSDEPGRVKVSRVDPKAGK